MRQYELMLLLKPDYDHANEAGLTTLLKKMIGGDGHTIKSMTVLGKKRLSYQINKYDEGVYVLAHLDGKINVTTVEAHVRMDKDVLRYLLLSK